MSKIGWLIFLLAIVGLLDASYLTFEHYNNAIPPCGTNSLLDCGRVLKSEYATIFNIPVALMGIFYYLSVIITAGFIFQKNTRQGKVVLVVLSSLGFMMSLYFIYLQLVVIKALCFYCMVSATTSTGIFIASWYIVKNNSVLNLLYAKK